ncbi:MAG TPA: hypothetical protein VJ841_04230 [Candidatus Saccharimonadales bacterium]|nr:hypothetical protein [Candidatus Saccharimonadales bacterium]
MNQRQQRIIIISGIILILVIFGASFFFATRSSNSNNATYTTHEYIDPASGDQVIDTTGKTPENGGSTTYTPTYYGMDELYNRGFSQDQVTAVRTFLNQYTTQQLEAGKTKIEKISLERETIAHTIDKDSGMSIYTLHLLINLSVAYTLTISSDGINPAKYALYAGSTATGTPVLQQ